MARETIAASATSSRLGDLPSFISRAAARSRSLRVRLFWFGRPFSASAISAAAIAAGWRRDRARHSPGRCRRSLNSTTWSRRNSSGRPWPSSPKRPADRAAAPDAVVDHEILAIEPPGRAHLAIGEIGELGQVEMTDVSPALRRPGRPADNVMLDVGRSAWRARPRHCLRPRSRKLVQLRIHLRAGQRHRPSPSERVGWSNNEIYISCQDTCLVIIQRARAAAWIAEQGGRDERHDQPPPAPAPRPW